jgi:NAD(P)H-dependent flavin oxidoreductase YrpB (nitropropane dioxygenase family)
VLDVVTVPVLAAGGISSARAMAAALAAGAAGIRVGTKFVATEESGAHPDYIAALLAADADATILVEAFSGGWPGAPHRVLSSAVAAAEAHPDEVIAMLETESGSQPIPRWLSATPSREMTPRRGHGAVRGTRSRPGHPRCTSRPGGDGVGCGGRSAAAPLGRRSKPRTKPRIVAK